MNYNLFMRINQVPTAAGRTIFPLLLASYTYSRIYIVPFHPALDEGHDEETEDFSMKEQRGFIMWAKAHKKELAIAGICLATLIATILCYKNKDALKTLWTMIKKRIDSPAKAPVKAVVAHTPRSLPVNPVIEPAQPIIQVIQPVSEIAPTVARHATLVLFEVDPHIRDLHPGWHASPEKIATAAAHGFVLKDGQTWVEAYVKGGVAA